MTPAPTRRAGWAGAAETEQRLNATEPDGGNGWSREKTGERLEIVSTTVGKRMLQTFVCRGRLWNSHSCVFSDRRVRYSYHSREFLLYKLALHELTGQRHPVTIQY